jgi:hypothetical protein
VVEYTNQTPFFLEVDYYPTTSGGGPDRGTD